MVRSVVVHGGPSAELIDVAGTEWLRCRESAVHAKFESSLLSPVTPPGVSNDPVLITVAMHVLVPRLPEADHGDSVVDLEGRTRAVQVFFRDHAFLVAHEETGGEDGRPHGLLHDTALHLGVGHPIVLLLASVFEMPILTHTIRVTARTATPVLLVVTFEIDTVFHDILVGFEHPTTVTDEVVLIAVHELLYRVLLQRSCLLRGSDHR